jgi:large subunit ribosomal protein L1
MSSHQSKRYKTSQQDINADTLYSLKDALDLVIKTSTVSFDASLEMHIGTSTDPKHADQMIRFPLQLPHGTGKKIRIAVYTEENMDECKKAGADIIGSKDILDDVLAGHIKFDVLLTSGGYMKDISKAAKILGPKSLMPSPKSGTVSDNLPELIKQIKAGKISVRNDKYGIIHLACGKMSFGVKNLEENVAVIKEGILQNKPKAIKGIFIKNVYLTSSMGPSVPVDVKSFLS